MSFIFIIFISSLPRHSFSDGGSLKRRRGRVYPPLLVFRSFCEGDRISLQTCPPLAEAGRPSKGYTKNKQAGKRANFGLNSYPAAPRSEIYFCYWGTVPAEGDSGAGLIIFYLCPLFSFLIFYRVFFCLPILYPFFYLALHGFSEGGFLIFYYSYDLFLILLCPSEAHKSEGGLRPSVARKRRRTVSVRSSQGRSPPSLKLRTGNRGPKNRPRP